jgi:T5orf172 domain
MATLAGQRAQFTWALRQYNSTEDPAEREFYARRMARYIAAAPGNNFTVEQITQGQAYPEAEVTKYLNQPDSETEPDISEQEALNEVRETVDTSDVIRLGEGSGFVYAYGYACAPDRLKVGMTATDTVQRIAAQISTGTPDKPLLKLEIRTEDPSKLEGAIHAVLDYRGRRVAGGGREWFLTKRDELVAIYEFATGIVAVEAHTNSKS